MTDDLPHDLTLPFLEQRGYLHGTTLFDALAPLAPAGATLDFKVVRVIDTPHVRLHDKAAAPKGVAAGLSWPDGGVRVEPLAAFGEPARTAYDERVVTSQVVFDDDKAAHVDESPLGLTQTLIPLHKALLAKAQPVEGDGQWMFTRLVLDHLPAAFLPLGLRLTGVLGGGNLVKSRITVAGADAGDLYFSWVG